MGEQNRVAIYARISDADQKGLDMQISAMEEFATHRGWVIVGKWREVYSGAKKDRPLRTEIMHLARQRKIDIVLVFKLDRWSRNLSDLVVTLDELTDLGVAFVSTQEMFDMTTSMGKAFTGLLGVFAEFERNMIRERVQAGVKRYREKNQTWGRPAIAMKFAPVVKLMLQEGKSKGEICRELNISKSSIARIMRK
jgi:DNA invertase Pin-like site-specific DNA recombinase